MTVKGFLFYFKKMNHENRHSSLRNSDTRELPDRNVSILELLSSREALRLSEERLALAFEATGSIGWYDWDVATDMLRGGEHFARMYGVSPELAARGEPIATYMLGIHPDDRDRVGAEVQAATVNGGAFRSDYRLKAPDGTVTWVHSRGRVYVDDAGNPTRFTGVILDITDRKAEERRSDALAELGDSLRDLSDAGEIAFCAAEILGRTLDASRAGFGLMEDDGETIDIQPDWCASGIASIAGRHAFSDFGDFVEDLRRGETFVAADVANDPRTVGAAGLFGSMDIGAMVNVPIVERGNLVSVVLVHFDRKKTLSDPDVVFLRTVSDRTRAEIARVRAEEQRKMLTSELNHRLKNTLSMVQAIATQTLRNSPDIETARKSLGDRLAALSRAHDILVSGVSDKAELSEVVAGAVALHDAEEGRIRTSGPRIGLDPSAALSMALMLHELATNAGKYGALSAPEGRVSVDWSVDGFGLGDEPATFLLTWRETGGPDVAPPARRGFGTRLISGGIGSGVVDLAYPSSGVVCTLSVPLNEIVAGA